MSALVPALAAGAVVGLTLGALGGGGSVLAVPALIYLLGFTPAAATTASLIIVAATSLSALYAHARTGSVRWRAGALFAAAGLLPAAAAGAVAARLPQPVLTAAFALVAALAAVRMLRPARTTAPAKSAPATTTSATTAAGAAVARTAPARTAPEHTATARTTAARTTVERTPAVRGSAERTPAVRPARVAGAGAGLGALTGLLGVGGGFLAVPTLVTVLAFEMPSAVGTSLLVISADSVASLATRGTTTAGLDWAVIAPFTGAAILGAWDGRRLAAKVTGALLRRTFAVLLLAVAAFMLLDALT
ncbi:sulfite exporter TauE/SafE family protein [Streptomyces sp. NRRL S-340]|uniref:TSUP family transporter n=1 Tax=Streptomyces sp. NRRL S-340 TaxID=1463901 RepID=UPI0005606592